MEKTNIESLLSEFDENENSMDKLISLYYTYHRTPEEIAEALQIPQTNVEAVIEYIDTKPRKVINGLSGFMPQTTTIWEDEPVMKKM